MKKYGAPQPAPAGFEEALVGEEGAHAIQCDCDFDPVCDDATHRSPEYHIGVECGKVQDAIRAAHAAELARARVETWMEARKQYRRHFPNAKLNAGLDLYFEQRAAAAQKRGGGE